MVQPLAVIVGVGSGLSASLARALGRRNYRLVLAARDTDKLHDLAAETYAATHALDATDAAGVERFFSELPAAPRVLIYNPSYRVRGALVDVDPTEVRRALEVTGFGAFLCAQAATRGMLKTAPVDGVRGTMLFTGASAGVKGFPKSAAFAMGKFAQRGLVQSMARELHPQGIHVAWVNIDGAIRNPNRKSPTEIPDAQLDPDAIAESYMHIVEQHRSAWSDEITLRPWVESF